MQPPMVVCFKFIKKYTVSICFALIVVHVYVCELFSLAISMIHFPEDAYKGRIFGIFCSYFVAVWDRWRKESVVSSFKIPNIPIFHFSFFIPLRCHHRNTHGPQAANRTNWTPEGIRVATNDQCTHAKNRSNVYLRGKKGDARSTAIGAGLTATRVPTESTTATAACSSTPKKPKRNDSHQKHHQPQSMVAHS